ncbi:hypothetical protein PLICRDRAFT_30833 [Plicaturopsis crispa FD-325 SS-3]|nr:hypothetical protein PLICRDRAFT_30833 [Plicaturopsis crispa FD-325 SS-3]
MNFDKVQSHLYVLGYRVQGALARYNRPILLTPQSGPWARSPARGETPPPGNDGQPTRCQPSRGQKPKAPTTSKSNPPPPMPKPTSRRRSKTPTSREIIENSDEEQPPLVKQTPKITPRKPILDDGDAHTSQDNTGNKEPRGRTMDRKGKGRGKASPPADSDPVATPAQPTAVKRRRSASAASTRSMCSRAMSRESTAAPDVEDDSDKSDTSDMIVRPRCGWCKSKGIACVEHQGGKACEACYLRKAKCDTLFPSKSKKRARKKPKKSALKSNIQTTTPAAAGSQTSIKIRLSRPRLVSRGPTPGPSGHHHEESRPPTTTPQPQNHAPPQKTKVGPPQGVKRPRVADGNVRPRSNMEVVGHPVIKTWRTYRASRTTTPKTGPTTTRATMPNGQPSSTPQTSKAEPRPQFVPGSPIYIDVERLVTPPSPPTAAPQVQKPPIVPLRDSAASSSNNAAGSSSHSAAAAALLNAATASLRNAAPASHPAQPSPPAMTTTSVPPPVESVPPQQTSPESNSADLSHHLKTIIEAQVHQVMGPYITAASTTGTTASAVQNEGLVALQEAQRLVHHAEATEERITNMVEQALQEMRAIAERLQSGDVDPTLLERTLPHLLRQDLDEALAAAKQSRSMLPPNVTDAPPPVDMIFQSSHPANIPSSSAAPTDQPAAEVTGGEESMDIETLGTEAN